MECWPALPNPDETDDVYESLLLSYLHRESFYLFLEKASYRAHKTEANLLSLYEQEVNVCKQHIALLRYKREPPDKLQWFDNMLSRLEFLASELHERLRRADRTGLSGM